MNRLSSHFLCVLCLSIGIFIVLPTVKAQQVDNFNYQKLDEYLQSLYNHDKFMGSVAVAKEGEVVFSKAYGQSYKGEHQITADSETIYRIGSITKMFTATMIMQLVEEDKLSPSQKLADFFPEVAGADLITIKHLLAHQSGLFNLTNRKDYQDWMTEEHSKEQMVELIRSLELQFDPGEKSSYSNTNYILLGYIIEKITGESYASQLETRITEPLNLAHTAYGDKIEPANREAASFRWKDSNWTEMPETDISIPHGAGAIVSTPKDLITFIQALFNGSLVTDTSLNRMMTLEQNIGLGLFSIPFYDKSAYGHSGGIDGFQSNVAYFPKQDLAIAVTANALNYSFNDILIGILSITFGREFTLPSFNDATITLTPNQQKQFVGNYASPQLPMDIEVFIKNKKLFAQATGQNYFPLKAASETTLKNDLAGIVMEFDSLKSGKYSQFTLKQRGVTAVFSRK